MWLIGGFIIGVWVGLWLSSLFIFPADVLNLKFAFMTIGDVLRIIAGCGASLISGCIGAATGEVIAGHL